MNKSVITSVVVAAHRRSRFFTLKRIVGMGFVLVALAGCAGAEVTDLAQAKVESPPPARILVEVSAVGEEQAAREAAPALQSEVIEQLVKAGVVAQPFMAGTRPPGAVLLHVSIMEAEPGSGAGRFLLGFGAGRAKLLAKARLESTDTVEIVSFNTASDSGRMPGLVLPGGVALATASIVPLAIGGTTRVVSSVRGGFDGTINRTANVIVDQLKDLYASVGWHWPAES